MEQTSLKEIVSPLRFVKMEQTWDGTDKTQKLYFFIFLYFPVLQAEIVFYSFSPSMYIIAKR